METMEEGLTREGLDASLEADMFENPTPTTSLEALIVMGEDQLPSMAKEEEETKEEEEGTTMGSLRG